MKLPVSSFLDELLSIDMEKRSEILRDIGDAASKFYRGGIRGIPSAVSRGVKDFGGALGSFAAPVENAKAGLGREIQGFNNSGRYMKALTAFNTLKGARDVALKEDPTGQGRSRTHRLLSAAGTTAGGMIAGHYGLVGGLAGSMIGGSAANALARRILPKQAPTLEQR